MKTITAPNTSALENIQVLYQDDRDASHPDRWKIYRYRVEDGDLQILIKGHWCPAVLNTTSGVWGEGHNDPLRSFSKFGYTYSMYGFLSKQPAEPAQGFSFAPELAARFGFLKTGHYGPACAVLELKWPVNREMVKRAYRAKSKAAHPDAGGSSEEFNAVQEAYELLMDYCEQGVIL